jgi:hypothetical protein
MIARRERRVCVYGRTEGREGHGEDAGNQGLLGSEEIQRKNIRKNASTLISFKISYAFSKFFLQSTFLSVDGGRSSTSNSGTSRGPTVDC